MHACPYQKFTTELMKLAGLKNTNVQARLWAGSLLENWAEKSWEITFWASGANSLAITLSRQQRSSPSAPYDMVIKKWRKPSCQKPNIERLLLLLILSCKLKQENYGCGKTLFDSLPSLGSVAETSEVKKNDHRRRMAIHFMVTVGQHTLQQAHAGRVRPKLLYSKVGIIITVQPSRTRPTGNNYTIFLSQLRHGPERWNFLLKISARNKNRTSCARTRKKVNMKMTFIENLKHAY